MGKRHKQEIINSFHTYSGRRINNESIEGRNRYIKKVELANSYRNFKRFRHRILYIFNKHFKTLDKPMKTQLLKLPAKERANIIKRNFILKPLFEILLLVSLKNHTEI